MEAVGSHVDGLWVEEEVSLQLSTGLRIQPFTRDSQQENTKLNTIREYGFSRKISLPDCEALDIFSGSIPNKYIGVPLEEPVFNVENTFCVIARRSSSYYLYRFSANNSFFVFSPWSKARRVAIRVSSHRFFHYFVMTTILLNCVFLALTQPIEETEFVFLFIYTSEMVIKSLAKGFILNKYAYLRNPWNWLDFIVVVLGYTTLGLQATGVAIGSLAGLRTLRVLRALKTVSITPGLKTIVNAMLHSIKMLAEVMALTLFCLMVFALLALQLYMGLLKQKCVIDADVTNMTDEEFLKHVNNPLSWLDDIDGQPAVCGNRTGTRYCPKNYTCLPDVGDNPNFGYTNFDSYGWAILTTFQLITLDFWEDVYNRIIAVTGPVSVLYFILVVFFGSFYLVNLTLAVVAISYEEEAASTLREHDKVKKFSNGFVKFSRTLNKIKLKAFSSNTAQGNQKFWCRLRKRKIQPTEENVSAVTPVIQENNTVGGNKNEPNEGSSSPDHSSHPLCMGPDIVISTGERLPYRVDDDDVNREGPANRRQRVKSVSIAGPRNSEASCSEHRQGFSEIFIEDHNQDSAEGNYKYPVFSLFYNCCFIASRGFMEFFQCIRQFLVRVANSPLLDLVITVCIVANTGLLALEHDGMSVRIEMILRFGNLVFTSIFTTEALIKILALGRVYFQSRWNIFDLVVVIVSIMDLSFETATGLSALRTFRLMRVMKLAQAWPTMRLLLTIIASTLGAVANMIIVLAVIVYVFAVLGMQLFSDIYVSENFYPEEVPRWNFTDFWHSVLMIFRILCGEWVQPLWNCMQAAGDKNQLCIVLFLVTLIVGNFLVLNLFLAMLLNSFNTKELKERKEQTEDTKLMEGFRRLQFAIRRRHTTTIGLHQNDVCSVGNRINKRRWSEPFRIYQFHRDRRLSDALPTYRNQNFRSMSSVAVKGDPTNALFKTAEDPYEMLEQGEVNFIKEMKKHSLSHDKEPINCCPISCYSRAFCFWNSALVAKFAWWRRGAMRVVDHQAFEYTTLLLIFASSILLCFEDVYLSQRPRLVEVLMYLNRIFTVLFVIEMALKWMADGFVKYFTNFWTLMDFTIVCVSVFSIVLETSGSGLYALRSIRTLRALRPLRAISRWQGMRIVVNALMSAIPSIFNVLLVCMVFWLIFSIMGIQFFGGRFYKCVDNEIYPQPATTVSNKMECLLMNFTWMNSEINFDNVGNSYLALFQVATFEGWMEIMADATDITGYDLQPRPEANFPAYLYFVVFIICGSFFTLNLFIGVIIDNFNMLKKKYEGGILEMFLTDSQRTYYTAMQKLGKKKPQRIIPRPQNKYLAVVYDVAISRRFETLVFALILINMFVMMFEHQQQPEDATVILETLNIVFTSIFVVEAAIKIIGLRYFYFTVPWNIFDFMVLIPSVVGLIFEETLQKLVISPTLLRVIRLVRIGRVLRLIKATKGIRKLLFTLVISLPALFNIGALLFLIIFVYAIIGMSLFGNVRLTGSISETVNFQTFAHSMILLFRLTTSAGWNDVLDSLMVQPPDCDPDFENLPNGNCGYPTIAILYFVSFIIINFMVIINMYIAIILENLNQANKEEETGISEEDIELFYVVWSRYDPHATQFIHFSQLSDFIASLDPPLGIQKPNIPAIVAMNLPISKGDRIHCLDILHALVKLELGDVEDTEEFRTLQNQMNQRFKKTFPTRSQVEIVTSTMEWKRRDNAARIIQRYFKKQKSNQSQLDT